jgi:exodeoxyribonuclease VII small subunit
MDKKINDTEKSFDFEAAMKKLDGIATELGKENISLDESLKLYEEGVRLVRLCNEKLTSAERTVKLLQTDSDGVISEIDFGGSGV